MTKNEHQYQIAAFRTRYPNGGTRGVRMPNKDRKLAVGLWQEGMSQGLSTRESAKELGFSDSALCRWKNGDEQGVKKPKAKKTKKATRPATTPPAVHGSSHPKFTARLPNGTKVSISGMTMPEVVKLLESFHALR